MIYSKWLCVLGSLILLFLGTIHLVYTFSGEKLKPREEALRSLMKTSFPVLTKQTTMWKAWIGFNASHSLGAIFLGIMNLYICFSIFEIIYPAFIFFIINILTLGFYVWLSRKYWFKIPGTGILISFCCYIAAAVLFYTTN